MLKIKEAIVWIKDNCKTCVSCQFMGYERCNILRYPKHWEVENYNGLYKAEVLEIKRICNNQNDCRACFLADVNRGGNYFCRIMNIPKDWDLTKSIYSMMLDRKK